MYLPLLLPPWHSLSLPDVPSFLKGKLVTAFHPSIKNSQPGSLGKSFPRPQDKGHPTRCTGSIASRIGALIQGQFFPPPLLLLLCCMFSCCSCFSTDTCQKKNNSAPQRHFNNSYSTSVPTSLINKYLFEYNHFLLEWAVFRNEITIIVSKNMYE